MENQPLEQEVEALEEELRRKKEILRSRNGSVHKQNLTVPIAIVIAGILIGGALIYSRGGQPAGTQNIPTALNETDGRQTDGIANVSADDDAFLGKENAPVTIIEFSDFQCPFCRKFMQETLPQIKKEYIDTGKARFVYRDFPLVQIHSGATPAAEGAECAREQGKFWELHDKIFNEQEKQGQGTIQFTAQDVKTWASQIGLNASKFNQCLDSGTYRQEVEKDVADGLAVGVTGTPSIFVNGRLIVGAQPFAAFKVVIDEELKKAGK